jgi:hypothetical protein
MELAITTFLFPHRRYNGRKVAKSLLGGRLTWTSPVSMLAQFHDIRAF